MAVLLLMAVLFIHATVAEQPLMCPEGCSCQRSLKTDCSSQAFQRIPPDIHFDAITLNISNNSISKLGNDTFVFGSLPYLKVLYLNHNDINRIHPDAFVALENVRFIYLHHNKIQGINRDTFSGNLKLEILKLSHNPLRIPQKGPFLNVSLLIDLDISFCNITTLYSRTFFALRHLEYLRMSHNLLSKVDAEVLSPLKKLKQLYLSNNNISTLEHGSFASLKLLTLLDLSYNKLKALNQRVFAKQINLEVLYLSCNNLAVVEEDEFHSLASLKELYLQNNSLYTIEENLFRSSVNLKSLYIDNNEIHNLSKISLSKLESVTNIYISGNRLETISLKLVCELGNLTYLRFFGNRLLCDCDLKGLWEWSREQGVTLWGSCLDIVNFTVLDNSTVPKALAGLVCNVTSCDSEWILPQTDSHLTLVYILSALCPLMLFAICFICAVMVFTKYRKNAREHQNQLKNTATSSTGYLILDQIPRVQHMYTSDEREMVDSMECIQKQHAPVMENHLVTPYSVSPVLHVGACGYTSPAPPPVPARPPPDHVFCTLPHCQERSAMRSAAFSTSEEEESRPLMKYYRTAPTISKESVEGTRQPRRVRPRRRHHELSASDTEPWSSYSEGSGSVSITECDVAVWSGSEASTRAASEGDVGNSHA